VSRKSNPRRRQQVSTAVIAERMRLGKPLFGREQGMRGRGRGFPPAQDRTAGHARRERDERSPDE
jgi:hypothetical protein